MIDQPTPNVTRADVNRVLRREFPAADLGELQTLLDQYGAQGQPERDRVQVAALKLAAGRLDQLRYHVEAATFDYRDVLLSAEYPGVGKKLSRIDQLTASEQQKIVDADWAQYCAWLER